MDDDESEELSRSRFSQGLKTTLGTYALLGRIGRGGMGAVYRARNPAGQEVAVKFIDPVLLEGDAGLKRFFREGEVLARLAPHRNVVGILDAGEQRGWPFLVLELVDGTPLREALDTGKLTVARAVAISRALARALAHVHQAGILHRDVKPGNVILRHEDGEPVLIDFGLAAVGGATKLTRTGETVGTPIYMSPEQAIGLHAEVDARTDVHAVGVVLYEMLTRETPFRGASIAEVLTAVASQARPGVRALRPEVDDELDGIVRRAMALDANARTPTCEKLALELEAWVKRREAVTQTSGDLVPSKPRPSGTLVPFAAAVLVLGIGAAGLLARVALRSKSSAPSPSVAPSETPTSTPSPTASQRQARERLLQAARDGNGALLVELLAARSERPEPDAALDEVLAAKLGDMQKRGDWTSGTSLLDALGRTKHSRAPRLEEAAKAFLDEGIKTTRAADDARRLAALVVARGRLRIPLENGAAGDELLDALFSPQGILRPKLAREYWTGLFIAFLRLDVDLDDVCLEALGAKPDTSEPSDAAVRLYKCLPFKEAEPLGPTLDELHALSTSEELGDRTRAHALALLAAKESPEESVRLLERAVALDSRSIERGFALANAYTKVGRKAEALALERKLQESFVTRSTTIQFSEWIHSSIADLEHELEAKAPPPPR